MSDAVESKTTAIIGMDRVRQLAEVFQVLSAYLDEPPCEPATTIDAKATEFKMCMIDLVFRKMSVPVSIELISH